MRKLPLISGALVLALTALPANLALADSAPGAEAWEIGPIIKWRNRSLGMPLRPTASREGWFFDFPYPDASAGHVHYVTFPHGSLEGARAIRMRYRIDARLGTRFIAQESPSYPATLSLIFQRTGDTWTGRGRYETYRWWNPESQMVPLKPGVHEVVVRLDAEWVSVFGRTASERPEEFAAAKANASRVGFVLGSAPGRGHGVFATGPARLTVLEFEII